MMKSGLMIVSARSVLAGMLKSLIHPGGQVRIDGPRGAGQVLPHLEHRALAALEHSHLTLGYRHRLAAKH